VLISAGAGRGQEVDDSGPVRINPRPDLQWVGIEELDMALDFEFRRDVDEVEPADDRSRRDVETRFREILELDTEGFIGHPNLLNLDLNTSLWLTQREEDLAGAENRERSLETVIDYDVRGTFLREQIVPLTLYARRNQVDVDRQFGGTLESTISEYGLQLNIRADRFPTRIQAFHRETEQQDPFGGLDFSIDQYTIEADGQVLIEEDQNLWWDYEFDDVTETGRSRGPISFERHQASLTHTWDFGDDQQHQLRSGFRLFDESGDFTFRQLRLSERLRLIHSRTLSTWYDLLAEQTERDDFEQNTLRFTSTLRHQLFDSLTTTARAGGGRVGIPTDDYTSYEVFGDVAFDYTKEVPYGQFSAGLDLRGNFTDETERGTPVPVIGQLFTFDLSGLVIIQGRNIDPASIVVLDASGIIVFDEGQDYTVRAFPDRVDIRRVPGGDIPPQATVRIDFELGPEPGGETVTTGTGIEARYRFNEGIFDGLSAYVSLFDQDENRSIVRPDFLENDFTELRYGLEYDIWKLNFKAEREIRDSTLSPFEITRLEARYFDRISRGSALSFSVLYQEIDRTEDNIVTETTTFTGQWRQQISSRLSAALRLQYQLEDDTAGIDSQAFDQELDLRWRYRQTYVYTRFRNSFVDSDADDTMFQTIEVGLRREF
jgi:hypothetical protein